MSIFQWGAELEYFTQNNSFISDVIFSLTYAAVFIVFVALRIQKRKRLKAEGRERKTAGLALLIAGLGFGVLAILEAANVISSQEIIASLFT